MFSLLPAMLIIASAVLPIAGAIAVRIVLAELLQQEKVFKTHAYGELVYEQLENADNKPNIQLPIYPTIENLSRINLIVMDLLMPGLEFRGDQPIMIQHIAVYEKGMHEEHANSISHDIINIPNLAYLRARLPQPSINVRLPVFSVASRAGNQRL